MLITMIGIVISALFLALGGCEERYSEVESQSTVIEPAIEPAIETVPQEGLKAPDPIVQPVEQTEKAVVVLEENIDVRRNTSELGEIYTKLNDICEKAVQTQKNMLEVEYDTTTNEAFDAEMEIIALKHGKLQTPPNEDLVISDQTIP